MIAEGTLFNGKLPSAMDKDTFVVLVDCIADNKYARETITMPLAFFAGAMLNVKQ